MNRYEALKHAAIAHAERRDKCGQPYILHPIAVAGAVEAIGFMAWLDGLSDRRETETAVVVALLHGVLEDTDYELDASDFTLEQWSALVAITRRPDQTHAEYIEGVCDDRVASIVKLADLWHNLSPERQACLPERERKGLEKRYLKARERIWEALGYRWWPES